MRKIRPALGAALLAGALLLAGCIAGEEVAPDESAEETPERSEEPTVTETTGAIQGTARDEDYVPLAGARITLLDTARGLTGTETLVARDGTWTLNNLEPAHYVVHIQMVNYDSQQRPATVKAGEITRIDFILERLKFEGPWMEEQEFAGFVSWAAAWQVEPPVVGCIIIPSPVLLDIKSCGGLRGGGSDFGETRAGPADAPPGWPGTPSGSIETDLSDVKTILVEMDWEPAGALGEHFLFDFMCSDVPRGQGGAVLDTEHACYFEQRGASPLIHRVDESHWSEHGYNFTGQWAARVFATYGALGTHGLTGIDVGAAYQQSFTKYWTIFHGEPAPEGYSSIPDV